MGLLENLKKHAIIVQEGASIHHRTRGQEEIKAGS